MALADVQIHLADRSPQVVTAWRQTFAGAAGVTISEGDIFGVPPTDAIVSTANSFGYMDGGIDAVYAQRFGPEVVRRLRNVLRAAWDGELPVGCATIVETGDREIPYLVSAPTMRVPMDVSETVNAYLAFRAALLAVRELNRRFPGKVRSVLCPGLATSYGRMSPQKSARQMRFAHRLIVEGDSYPLENAGRVLQSHLHLAEGRSAGREVPLRRTGAWRLSLGAAMISVMKALILVDVQNDFIPGGALPVPEGDTIVPLVNRLQSRFDLVVATQDWHPPDHGSFAANHPGKRVYDVTDLGGLPQVLWPVHCVQQTPGADFIPGLDRSRIERVFRKGTDPAIDSYSGFFDNGHRKSTGLGEYLKSRGVRSVYVCGLAADYCVKFTALDARQLGFNAFLIEDATRGVNVNPRDVERAVAEMRATGVRVIRSDEVAT